ncbi:MAG TPA: PLP-dependent aminotransferase family protein [Holophagaceae bacterium]|nr:PLP-dependent aminotransferase family protein [Holophagaceae bacterium]
MRPWTFPLALEPGATEPLFLQIARGIAGDVRRGRLRPGDALPGSRTLAEELGVHRNTVLAALRELEAEGWIEAEARVTRVARDLPTAPGVERLPKSGLGFDLVAPEPMPELAPAGWKGLDLAGGLPDPRLIPVDELGRALRRALKARPTLLDYGSPLGEPRLRSALASLLSEVRGLACPPDQLMITSGSLQAVDLAARLLFRPGDRVGVEDPGYPPVWQTLRAAGAELVPLPVDAEGLQVEGLEARLPLRAIYLTPHHQFPTTGTLSPARRMRLLDLARRHRIALLEDDYDFEFHFEGRPVLPLASGDTGGVVVYMGTLSKILAPGLRLGWVAGPKALVEALAAQRRRTDLHGNRVMEGAVAEFIEDGLLQRHARKMRRMYGERREALLEALAHHLPESLDVVPTGGGLSLWAHTARGLDPAAWAARALAAGVLVMPGRRFDFRGRKIPFLRLGFAALAPREIREAVRRLKEAR